MSNCRSWCPIAGSRFAILLAFLGIGGSSRAEPSTNSSGAVPGGVVALEDFEVRQDPSAEEDEAEARFLLAQQLADEFERIRTGEVRALPLAERVAFYRHWLDLAWEHEQLLGGEAADHDTRPLFVVKLLAGDVDEVSPVLEVIEVLRDGRERWQHKGASWAAELAIHEAIKWRALGVLDLSTRLLEEAVDLVDHTRESPAQRNAGAYFKAHIELIQNRSYLRSDDSLLEELYDFETGADWEWGLGKMKAKRTGEYESDLALLRAHVFATRDDVESREEARNAFEAYAELPYTRPGSLVSALANVAWLGGQEMSAEEVKDLLEALDAAMARLAASEEPTIWVRLEYARARAQVSKGEALVRALEELEEVVEDYLRYLRANSLKGGNAAGRYGQYRGAIEVLLGELEQDEVLDALISWQSVGRLWATLDRPSPSAKQVTKSLCAKGSGVLTYLRGSDRDRWIVLNESGATRVFPVKRLRAWQDRLLEFQSLLAVNPGGMPKGQAGRRDRRRAALAGELSGILFSEDLRKELSTWSRLYLVGRDELMGLSLEALSLDPAGGEPLGVSKAIVDLPSLAVAPALLRLAQASAKNEGLQLVADARVPKKVTERYGLIADLKLSRGSLLGALGVEQSKVGEPWLHQRAVAARLRVPPKTGGLHLVLHGVRDPYRELTLMLAMTPDGGSTDGLVGVEQIRRIPTAPRVLLSVCSGANAAPRNGDAGSNHLGGAFLEAGAHSVVLSACEVQLDASLAFYRSFYDAIDEGASSAEAARVARAALLSSEDIKDPFHWGQVRVFGIGK